MNRFEFDFHPLEPRCLFSAALDLIGVNALRADPVFAGIDGSGVTVAVIDTGVDFTHPLLSAAKITEKDIVYGGTTERLTDEHGTHVAGIVGARNDNIGVATGVGLIGIQVFTESRNGGVQAYDADIEKALKWVYDNAVKYNIVAVNMSLGSGNYVSAAAANDNILYDDVKRLEGAGITVVSAAGNSYADLEKQGSASPAVFSTLDVGAVYETNEGRRAGAGGTDFTTDADRLTYFSQRPNTGNQIFAPGAYITSTVPGGKTQDLAGTSMAAPMVTGVVALMQEAAVQFGGRRLSTAEIQSIIRQTADTIVDGDDENTSVKTTGATYQRVNAYSAVRAVRNLFTGGVNTGEVDPNGTIAGAVNGPELDDSPSAAIESNIGSDGSTSVGGDDVDLYRISVTSPGELKIDVDTSTFQAVLRVFSAAGTPVDLSTAGGNSGFSRVVSLQSGTYYVGLSSAPNSVYNPNIPGSGPDGATGTYAIAFSLDTADADGVIDGATDISVGTGAQAITANIGQDPGKSVGASDVDFYRVTVPDDGTLLVDIDTNGSSYPDTYVRVFDEDGNQKSFSDDDLAEDISGQQIEFRSGLINVVDGSGAAQGHKTDSFIGGAVTKGTTYYIAVANFENRAFSPTNLDDRISTGSTGGYSLFVSFRNGDANGAIPQAVVTTSLPLVANPGEIGSDGTTAGLVSVGDRDVDFIKLNSPTAGILKIDIDSNANGGSITDPVDAVVRLFDSSGNLLALNDNGPDGADPLLYYEISADTDYYLAVSGAGNDNFDPFLLGSGGSGDTGEYSFSASVLSESVGANLSDDSASDGGVGRLFLDQALSGTLGDDSGFAKGASDVDLYHFTAPFTGEFTFTAGPDDAFGADTFLRVFNSAGTQLAKDDNGGGNTGGSEIVVNLTGGQSYLVGVSGAGPDADAYDPVTGTGAGEGDTGGYTLNVTAGERFVVFGPDNKAVYTDSDGTPVSITLTGSGSGTVFFDNSGNIDASRILLENTTDGTLVTIRGATSVGQISVAGSLKSLAGKEVNLNGDLSISGTVRVLQFANISGADVTVAGSAAALSLTAGVVTDSSITSASPIKSLKVAAWNDTAGDDVIAAPSVISASSSAGFAASINAGFVGKIKVAGRLDGDVRSTGNIDSISADTFGDVRIFAGVVSAVNDLPDAPDDFASLSAVLKSVVVRSKAGGAFGRSLIAAPVIRKAVIGDVVSVAGAPVFGLAADVAKSIKGSVNGVALKLKDLDDVTDLVDRGEFVVRLV
ncbi:S8 family serine peptidase [Humisphaera borealis]|uniref:S8 family serine peptidase n=1 Tax=Humisphaera borealis TaxID=2807512 RepID=A0A7M2WY29_9BACT|nr:S8 family serine peptidase [Humisphaera borealis]QOV90408.1 S8 family serine peptidase [Humisphaera borealis]